MRKRRIPAMALALCFVPLAGVAQATSPRSGSAPSSAVTVSKDIARTHLINGQDVVAESHTFSLTVDETQNLRSLQRVKVSWTGAHPNTGNISIDPNSVAGAASEYPVVLLECSGADSPNPPAGQQQLDPTTCWTATSGERYLEAQLDSPYGSFPPWRLDRYATAAQRQAVVGEPAAAQMGPQATQNCENTFALPSWPPTYQRVTYWVPFRGGAGGTWYAGPANCAGMPPEASGVLDSSSALPTNETWGASDGSGSGSAKFDVWGSDFNASLGCSASVACSIVAVPVLGISCDPAGVATSLPPEDIPPTGTVQDNAAAACRAAGTQPRFNTPVPPTVTVDGSLWWAASNWRNRVSVPITFAPPNTFCATVSNKPEISVYGSELMTEATVQWAPHFCADSSFKFKHVQTAEPEARSILNAGGVDAAFASDLPAGTYGSRPVVNAPVAMTGFAIAFAIDDAQGNEVTSLRLTPRLLAKLLTESYPSLLAAGDPALAGNPITMAVDPEFEALNPDISHNVATGAGVYPDEGASTLLSLSTDSDVIQALTTYIHADPDTKAWLDGAPDPWGMVVNPNYRTSSLDAQHAPKLAMPTNSWPILDTYTPQFTISQEQCLFDTPLPVLPLIASPVSRMSYIAQDTEFANAQSQTVCVVTQGNNNLTQDKLVATGRQQPGVRFMLGLVSIAEANRYGLDAASLQTQVASGAPAKFTSADGRTFVAPTDASLLATSKLLTPDPSTSTWPIPYDTFRTIPQGANAYPGAMVVYAQIPTSGLPAAEASQYAELLRFAAGPGQTPGTATGQLPPGYLPMSAANGLGGLADYTLKAADAVAGQTGVVPPIVPGAAGANPSASPATSSGSASNGDEHTGSSPSDTSSPSPSASSSAPPGATPTGSTGTSGTTAVGPPITGLTYRTGGSPPQPVPAPGGVVGQAVQAIGKTVAIVSHVAASMFLWLVYIGLGALAGAGAFYVAARRRGLDLTLRGLIAAIKEALLNLAARRRSPR